MGRHIRMLQIAIRVCNSAGYGNQSPSAGSVQVQVSSQAKREGREGVQLVSENWFGRLKMHLRTFLLTEWEKKIDRLLKVQMLWFNST